MRARMAALVTWACVVSLGTTAGAAADLRLVEAVKAQDAKTARALLAQQVDPNTPEADGATPLHWAAYWDDLATAEQLIRARADVNAPNDLGVTPLSLACANGSSAMVEQLLAAGANPNISRPSGESPLMTCARTGNPTAVKALVARGAEANAKDPSRGQTALMWAVAAQHPAVVQALIEVGADVEARSNVSRRLVYTGMRYITSPPPVSSGTVVEMEFGGFTPLLFAAQTGDLVSARLLVAAGASVNDAAPVGTSPLVVAAHSGNGELGAFLLEKGADPNAAGAGYAALHVAVLRGDLVLVKRLLAHGADPNARLAKGTPVKKYSQDYALSAAWIGATPFWLAAKFAEVSIMRALVEAGADRGISSADGTPPLLAAIVPAQEARDRRERYMYPVEAALRPPGDDERMTLQTVAAALELGENLQTTNEAGDTAVHLAASAGFSSVIQLLADRGANLEAKNKRGLTPLALATGAGRAGRPAATSAATGAGPASVTAGGNAGTGAVADLVVVPSGRPDLSRTADLLRQLGAKE